MKRFCRGCDSADGFRGGRKTFAGSRNLAKRRFPPHVKAVTEKEGKVGITMKKLLTMLLALMLIAAMLTSALAYTMYVNTDPGKVHNKNSKDSKIISRLPYGGKIDVIEKSGNWAHINYINKNGVQKSGWIAYKHLSKNVPCKHKWSKWKVTKKATCTKVGSKKRHCTKCKAEQTKEIKKTGHSWGKWKVTTEGTCAKAGEMTRKCGNCGKTEKKSYKGDHSYGSWTTVRKATRTEAGERVRLCKNCGADQHEAIECGRVYARGDRGEDVRSMQRILNRLGYDPGSVDGIYGKKLDAAMGSFAADHGLTLQAGRIRPAEVDALVNAWVTGASEDEWKGQAGADSPVNLALTVTADGAPDESGVASYKWTLSNNGSDDAVFKALLLSFGDGADFRADDIALTLDGTTLRKNGGNTLSGSFSADAEWGEGSLNFAALASDNADQTLWLSNAVIFENAR